MSEVRFKLHEIQFMSRNYYLIIYLFFILGWSTNKNTLENNFEPNEILELKRITGFVIGSLTKNCDQDQPTCILNYLDKIQELNYEFELKEITKSEQEEFLNSLSKETFNDIWSICRGRKSISKEIVLQTESLCLNTKGKFSKFLIKYCSQKERLSAYGNTFEHAGDYTPSMAGQLFGNPTSFDLNSKEELLLISIHLLTLNSAP